MIFVFGYAITGVLLYNYLIGKVKKKDSEQQTERDVSAGAFYMKSGTGVLSLPLCRLIAVELGPSNDSDKEILQIVINNFVETEYKPLTGIEKKKEYVKITPTQYQTGVVLRTKKSDKVPITAYYSA